MARRFTGHTLKQARDYVFSHWDMGKDAASCPCCDQQVRRYPRTINSTQARSLIKLVRLYERDCAFHHTREIKDCATDFGQLAHWGLILELKNEDTGKRNSGFWIPSLLGYDFVYNKAKVPSTVLIYNQINYGYQQPKIMIGIADSLGKNFDYEELMRAR